MEEANLNKVKIILGIIFGVIILILLLFIISEFLKIDNQNIDDEERTTITTTKKVEEFKELTSEEKISFNELINNEQTLKGFNELIKDNDLYNVDLIQQEVNKFKIIYLYLDSGGLTFDLINQTSRELFNVDLYEPNLINYLNEDLYYYESDIGEVNYCFKSSKLQNNILLVDIINKIDNNCDFNNLDYENNLIINKVKIGYEMVDDKFIYKSFIVLK